MGRLTVLKQIAHDIACQFGPDCEVVIHAVSYTHLTLPTT